MRQFFKILTGTIIWLAIGLYVFPIVLLQIPAVQNRIGSEVEKVLSKRLGTKVLIDRINLGMLNRIIIDGTTIYDQQDKEMVKSRRLAVKISLPSLIKGRISISSAQVFATHLHLYKDSIGADHNFQFVLDSLSSKDTTSSNPLDLRINSLIMRQGSVTYDRYFAARTPGKLNPSHLCIEDISAHIVLKALSSDSVNLNIKRLAFNERSGIKVNRMSVAFKGSKQGCLLSGLNIRMPNSHLRVDTIAASYNAKNDKIDFGSLKFHGAIDKSIINARDFAFLSPSLADINDSIVLHSDFEGSPAMMRITNLHAETSLNMVSQLAGAKSPQANAGIEIDAACEIDTLGYGNIGFNLTSGVGNVMLNASLEDKSILTGQIQTDSILLGKLLDDTKLGIIKLQTQFEAVLDKDLKPQTTTFCGAVPAFDYNSYRYREIAFEGTYAHDHFKGSISSNDPNAMLKVDGALAKSNGKYQVDINSEVVNLAPMATNLSQKWQDAAFSGKIDLSLKGRRLEDIEGQIKVSDMSLESPERSYTLENLLFDARRENNEQTITLNSDFGHMRINGSFDYASLPNSIMNMVREKMPTIANMPEYNKKTNNKIQVYCVLDRTDWMEALLGIPLQLNRRTTFVAKIDDAKKEMYANCLVPQFYYNNQEYQNATIAITSPNDTLSCDLSIVKIMNNGIPFQLNMSNKAANSRLATSVNFDNNADKRLIGDITISTIFGRDNGATSAEINVMPSTLTINDDKWNISQARIVYNDKNINVSRFMLSHDNESITINGVASDSHKEQMTVSLRNIDVDYILNLVNFRSVRFGGKATGRAYIKAPFGNMEAKAKLMVNEFTFQDGRMGVLDANVNWDNTQKTININAVADDGPDALTYIDGYVSPSPGFIDLKIKAAGMHLDFLESFTSSFTEGVKGHVYGNANLIGPLSKINLVGDLIVNGEMNIKPLNTKYYLKNDTLKLIPDEIELKPSAISDIYGNNATLRGYIRHKHLTKLTYDLYVDTDNLLVYDFKDFGDEVFCGTVFGAGNVEIHGKSKELRMEVDLTTRPNSTFTYNVSTPDAIIDQKFINWNTKATAELPTSPNKAAEKPISMASDTYINFKINCTPDATVNFLMDSRTNDRISLHGTALLNAAYHNKTGFNMYGTYNVERGTYGMTIQDIIKKNFTFKEGGYLKFGGDPAKAQLNLQAVHTVNGVSLSDLNVGNSYSDNTTRVNCLLNITGEPFDLRLDYGIELPTASSDQERNIRSVIQGEEGMKQQVIYLLGFGRFMPQTNNNEAYQDPDKLSQTTQAMQGLLSGTISTQINNLLSSAINNNNWNFGANISTGDEGWHNAEYEGLLNGRLLNNRLIINGQFGYRDNVKTANSSFIGDFDVRYMLVPNGNLALRVYNQTNDRYFTKSSLNTQGIGIIIKKDFTNLGDLFGRKKKKK